MKRIAVSLFLLLSFIYPVSAEVVTGPSDWSKECPAIIDETPNIAQPKITGFLFNGTNQNFVKIREDGKGLELQARNTIGCYVEPSLVDISGRLWQVGVINRDLQGFYWKNSAGVSWRLELSNDGNFFITGSSNPYYATGNKFIFESLPLIKGDPSVLNCKLTDYIARKTFRFDFPISDKRISPVGAPKVLIVVADFEDSQYMGSPRPLVEKILNPEKVKEFFYANSYGQLGFDFTIYPTVVRSSILYKDARPVRSDSSYKVKYEVIGKIPKDVWKIRYESIFVLGYGVPEIFGAWAAGSEVPLDSVSYPFFNPGFSWSGIYNEADNERLPSWKIFAHELGHLLGFIDLGATEDPENYWRGRTPGPFDLMGQSPGKANEFLGWNRWLVGWISDQEVICISEFKETTTIRLNSISIAKAKKRMLVIKTSPSTAIIIEVRRKGIFDNLGKNEGVLVYSININNVYKPKDFPITILSRESDSVKRPYSPSFQDIDRFLEATLNPGQYIDTGEFLIQSLSYDGDEDEIEISIGEDRVKRLKAIADKLIEAEAKAKAEAEAKAKAEAEAKAKAEATKKKTIKCTNGKKTKKVKGANPQCPKGYKKK